MDNDKLKFKAYKKQKNGGNFCLCKTLAMPMRSTRKKERRTAVCEHHVEMYIIILCLSAPEHGKNTAATFFPPVNYS